MDSPGSFDTKYIQDDKGNLLVEAEAGGNKRYYHPDHLGSTRLVTGGAGLMAENLKYLPFGFFR